MPTSTTVLFADGTTIFLSGKDQESLNQALQTCLTSANLWMLSNDLSLNAQKTKSMLIHSFCKKSLRQLHLELNGFPIKQVRVFKFLGVMINDTLTWSDHINYISSKVSRNINLLRRLSWFLPWPLLVLFLKSYILPTFDYCDVVWYGCTQIESQRIEKLLNYSARIAFPPLMPDAN